MILEFNTIQDATACLDTINMIAAYWWASEGYAVVNDGDTVALISKNADSTLDVPTARTTTWDVIQTSPDDTFYFADPSSNPKYSHVLSMLDMHGEFNYTRKPMPVSWYVSGE